ncbi:MAG: helix-turn-helix transcriptional regulator, partial [Oscillospiraceae bacterium]|nr:helix-turn-helix transcriptional regulator [Oscillospiraceae bacterium]
IQYYRKRAGLSQEALAELVGVSRQAVSKWELDESAPEVTKLKALAGAFGITVDQLLSGEIPTEPQGNGSPLPRQKPPAGRGSDWPGLLGRLVRRNGWLAGVYIALSGLGTTLVGGIARFAFDRMFRIAVNDMFGYGTVWETATVGTTGNIIHVTPEVTSPFGQVTALSSMGQVFVTIATVVMVVGILTVIAGSILAAYLYKKGREE